ncbi:hypothetical protein ACMA1I_08165 [Pontibacter sp. 13R65]|uniref:hypothetical protein n=1 Tax=Pontibacter sp. 13R65 TaxID=3127458 RepID=UPI00301E31F6
MRKAVWAYNPSPTGEGASAWCVLYYKDTSPSRILYNMDGGGAIQRIQKRMRRRKIIIQEEEQQLERVIYRKTYTDYANDKYIMHFMKYNQPIYYGIKIFQKNDYLIAKKNGRL